MTLSGNTRGQSAVSGQYADIQDLHMYYELSGSGKPLVLIHGGGSTIESSFGRILPTLAKKYRIIAVELQAHGRTKDTGHPLSFERDADDVAGLLEHLNIKTAAIFGFSNGATTALQMAIRHPQQA
ncbi:MAG TPA: alpha/beta hydrolase, partial [Puia sp.]